MNFPLVEEVKEFLLGTSRFICKDSSNSPTASAWHLTQDYDKNSLAVGELNEGQMKGFLRFHTHKLLYKSTIWH